MSDEYSIASNFKSDKISAAEYERKMKRLTPPPKAEPKVPTQGSEK